MKEHKLKHLWSRGNLQVVLTNWFAFRRFGWNLNGYMKHVWGIQVGFIQITGLREGHIVEK